MTLTRHRAAGWCVSGALALSLCLQAAAQSASSRSPAAPEASALSTSDILRAVLHELSSDPHLVATGIKVAVSSGIVELTGTVPVWSWRERATRLAAVARGVRAFVNRIGVVPVRKRDSLLAQELRSALRHTEALARMRVALRVTDGVVVLDGAISTWDEQELAERVVTAVPGVRFCENQLSWTGAIKRTSAVIAADIRSRFDWDPLVQHDRIRVTARQGRVVLAGATGPAGRRRALALAAVKGVTEVDARALVVDPASRPDADVRSELPNDLEISRTIQDLNAYWPTLQANNLTTTVVAGIVTLRGTVQTIAEKRAAESLARSAVGVVAVRSLLRGPWWRAPVEPPPLIPPRRLRRDR